MYKRLAGIGGLWREALRPAKGGRSKNELRDMLPMGKWEEERPTYL